MSKLSELLANKIITGKIINNNRLSLATLDDAKNSDEKIYVEKNENEYLILKFIKYQKSPFPPVLYYSFFEDGINKSDFEINVS